MKRALLLAVLLSLSARGLNAQSTRAVLQQSLLRHARTPVTDITATGSITVNGVTRSTTVYVKGSDQIRIENGTGSERNVVIFARGQGWVGTNPALAVKPLTDHGSAKRPTQFPFLDLISELNNPNVQITDQGMKTLGERSVYHITIYLGDPKAQERTLKRPLDDQADFYIDAETFLVVRSERLLRTEEDMNMRVPSIMEFSDYRSVNGFLVPFKIVSTSGNSRMGMSQSITQFTTVRINEGVSDALFSIQLTGGRQ